MERGRPSPYYYYQTQNPGQSAQAFFLPRPPGRVRLIAVVRPYNSRQTDPENYIPPSTSNYPTHRICPNCHRITSRSTNQARANHASNGQTVYYEFPTDHTYANHIPNNYSTTNQMPWMDNGQPSPYYCDSLELSVMDRQEYHYYWVPYGGRLSLYMRHHAVYMYQVLDESGIEIGKWVVITNNCDHALN